MSPDETLFLSLHNEKLRISGIFPSGMNIAIPTTRSKANEKNEELY